jgi:hypothetical protein
MLLTPALSSFGEERETVSRPSCVSRFTSVPLRFKLATGRLAVLLGWVLPLGKIHSKSMREVLENLEAEVKRRSGR